MGVKSYFSSKVGSFTNDLKTIAGTENLAKNWEGIKEDFNNLIVPTKIKESKVEEFYESCLSQGVNYEGLKKIYFNLSLNFYIFLTILSFSLIFSIYNFVVLGNFLYGVTLLAFTILGGTQVFSSGFRAYQIKARKLCTLKEWYEEGEYFPKFNLEKEETDKILDVKKVKPNKKG